MEPNLVTLEKLKKLEVISSMKYVRLIRFFLYTISAWPHKELCENKSRTFLYMSKFYKHFLPALTFFMLSGCVYFICVTELDMLAFGLGLTNNMLTLVTAVRLLLLSFKEYTKITEEFFMKFHLVYFKNKGSHFEEVYEIVEKVSYYFAMYMCASMLFGSSMYNTIPLYTNYKNGALSKNTPTNITYDFSVFYAFPHFDQSDYFKTVTIANVYFSYNCGVSVCIIDLLMSIMVFHIIGHILILRKTLEKIEAPAISKSMKATASRDSEFCEIRRYAVNYSEEENKNFTFIGDFVKHHRIVLSFVERFTRFFGPVLGLNYMFHLVTLCLLLLECTEGGLNALIRFGPLTIIILVQLIQISVIFEFIGTVSEQLPDALYSIPWECLDIRHQRSVCILLHRLQSPIHVTALGMTPVGVTTMAGILKTTLSYFAFLRSLNE